MIFTNDKYVKILYFLLLIIEHQKENRHIQIQWKYVQCVSSDKVFSTFQKSIWKSLVECYVDEKWVTDLGLQVFHLKKQATFGSCARIPLSLWKEQEGVQGQKCSGKCLEASDRKAWIFKWR